jgi:hypothetical protein
VSELSRLLEEIAQELRAHSQAHGLRRRAELLVYPCPPRGDRRVGGLAVFAQRITRFSPSMASRETRSRPCGPAAPIDGCAAA